MKRWLCAAMLACGAVAWAEEKLEAVKIGPAKYQMPTTWERQRPSSEMRVAQFGVPLVSGDEGKAEMYFSYFQGGGGGVDANIQRWVGMFSDKEEKEKIDTFTANGFKITALDITGSYKDKPAPFVEKFELRKGWRMLAAVIETPDDGLYFVRLTGPKKTLAANAEYFTKMLKTISKN